MGHGPTPGTHHAAQAQTLEPPPSVPLCPRGPESLAVTRSGGDGSAEVSVGGLVEGQAQRVAPAMHVWGGLTASTWHLFVGESGTGPKDELL